MVHIGIYCLSVRVQGMSKGKSIQLWVLIVGAVVSGHAKATTGTASSTVDTHASAADCEAQFRGLMEDSKVDVTAE